MYSGEAFSWFRGSSRPGVAATPRPALGPRAPPGPLRVPDQPRSRRATCRAQQSRSRSTTLRCWNRLSCRPRSAETSDRWRRLAAEAPATPTGSRSGNRRIQSAEIGDPVARMTAWTSMTIDWGALPLNGPRRVRRSVHDTALPDATSRLSLSIGWGWNQSLTAISEDGTGVDADI